MPRTSLNVTLGWGVSGEEGAGSYALHAESVTDRGSRMPSVIPFPLTHRVNKTEDPDAETGRVETAAFDFGLLQQYIIVAGYVPDVEPNPDYDPYYPSKAQLENVLRTAWKWIVFDLDYQANVSGLMYLNVASDREFEQYGVVCQDWEFSRKGGKSAWEFRITFVVVTAPEDSV